MDSVTVSKLTKELQVSGERRKGPGAKGEGVLLYTRPGDSFSFSLLASFALRIKRGTLVLPRVKKYYVPVLL